MKRATRHDDARHMNAISAAATLVTALPEKKVVDSTFVCRCITHRGQHMGIQIPGWLDTPSIQVSAEIGAPQLT